jgi:hypothetical protein
MTSNTTRTVTARTTDTEHRTTILDDDPGPAAGQTEGAATTVQVTVPDDASPAEADAIATAVREHLVATGRLADPDGGTERWVTANRLQGVESDARTLLAEADADPWVAASRARQRW